MDKKIDIKDIKPGKVYSFWDDGKSGSSRQYLALVTRILSIDEAKAKSVFGIGITDEDEKEDIINEHRREYLHKVYDYWKYNVERCKYSDGTQLYDDETPFIVEAAIPVYDEHLIYFALCGHGTYLFSFDIQSSWQSGLLDIYNDRIDRLDDDLKEEMLSNKL